MFQGDIINEIRKNEGITLRYFDEHDAREVADDEWYFPALPDETAIVQPEQLERTFEDFAAKHKDKLLEDNMYLGVWLNPESNEYYFDINTAVADAREAIELAKQINTSSKRQILALYNPKRDRTVYL